MVSKTYHFYKAAGNIRNNWTRYVQHSHMYMCFCITVLLNIGEFGIVFRGLLTINDIAQPVAVKTLKGIVINVTYIMISL